MKTTIGIATISPLFMLYGKLVETKNGWKTFNFLGCLVNPNPVTGSTAKPVIIQEVIVSGTFFEIVVRPSKLPGENFLLDKYSNGFES